jgi:hypothetical protein
VALLTFPAFVTEPWDGMSSNRDEKQNITFRARTV